MSDVKQYFLQAPPIARTFALATVLLSACIHSGLLSPQWFYFGADRIIRFPPEIWRVFTSFLLTYPKLSIIFDTYFVFSYLSQLETGARFTRKEDLLWYLAVVGSMILVIGSTFLGSAWFLQGMIMALVYTATQDQRGAKTTFYIITIPAQLTPYCMMGVNALMAGPEAVWVQAVGLLAAHSYDFFARLYPQFGGGPNLVTTPAFLSRLANSPFLYQHVPGAVVQPGQGSGHARPQQSGVLPDSWRTRGQGQRLG